MAGKTGGARRRFGWVMLIGLSGIAAALLVIHLRWPARVDAITLVLLVLVALPGLGLVLDSAELPGGVKVQFRRLEQRVERNELTAEAAIGAATAHATRSVRHHAPGAPAPFAPVAVDGLGGAVAADGTAGLAGTVGLAGAGGAAGVPGHAFCVGCGRRLTGRFCGDCGTDSRPSALPNESGVPAASEATPIAERPRTRPDIGDPTTTWPSHGPWGAATPEPPLPWGSETIGSAPTSGPAADAGTGGPRQSSWYPDLAAAAGDQTSADGNDAVEADEEVDDRTELVESGEGEPGTDGAVPVSPSPDPVDQPRRRVPPGPVTPGPAASGPAMPRPTVSGPAVAGSWPASPVAALVAEYDRIRRDRPSGPRRTSMLTELCGRLIVETAADPSFDPAAAMGSADPGWRLAGYAAVYGRPDAELLGPVIAALTAESVAFNRYWAVRAAGKVLDRWEPFSPVPPHLLGRLTDLRRRLDLDSDEWFELDAILAGLQHPAVPPYGS
ncbi:hypothetical protein [Actinocatenispora sera]|uniref:Uncharacterized protein n=1 Tax=Actinocatenispora sera TaxID=390989 RepID=A0A810L123_9ACTN|nr:hypothetical protein [Actinocatenispora sera]BCJ28352.1 hypothetical protein Asera_24600 [Actinocatenispora sera]